jgi:hypothetical protein
MARGALRRAAARRVVEKPGGGAPSILALSIWERARPSAAARHTNGFPFPVSEEPASTLA